MRTTDTAGLRLDNFLGEQPRVVTVHGNVVTEPKAGASHFATFLLRLQSIECDGQTFPTDATIFARWRGNVSFADDVALFGMMQSVAGPRNPGEFDMRAYLARQDVRHAIFVRYAEEGHVVRHHAGNPILRVAQRSRRWLQATICRGLDDAPDVQNFLSGIVLGLRHQTTEDIEEPFQQTGTLHLFAVAGLHVGIVARLLWLLASVAQLSRRSAAAVIIPLLFFYAAVTGLHVSSVRAAIMASVLVGACFFERKPLVLNSLAAAAFVLFCWNTNELFASGFQLSFAVVGTIVIFAEPLSGVFHRWSAPDAFLPDSLLTVPRRLWHSTLAGVASAGAASAAAWAGSLVLIATYFYLVAPISLVANIIVVPIAFFILGIAMLSVIVAPVATSLSVVFNNANFVLAHVVLAVVHLFAQFPQGHFYLGQLTWPDGARARIDVLDVGAGAAVGVTAGHRHWLFDCGGERDYNRILRPYLHAAGINHLDGLLLSHGDSLHIGGAPLLFADLAPARLLDNLRPDRSRVHRQVRAIYEKAGFTWAGARADDSIALTKDVSATILHPSEVSSAGTADDQAIVVQLRTPAARILFMSDNGEETERSLLMKGCDLRSDIVIKGQNHSTASGGEAFLQAVQPRLIIATSRNFPRSECISEAWAERVRARGIRLFRQDETGAIQMRFWDTKWEAKAYLTGEVFRSTSR